MKTTFEFGALVMAGVLSTAAQAAGYTVTLVQSDATAVGVNDAGNIVSRGTVDSSAVAGKRVLPLTDPAGLVETQVSAINDRNQAVGTCNALPGVFYGACLWDAEATATVLAVPAGTSYSTASAISDSGLIAGAFGDLATVWRGGVMQFLALPAGTRFSAAMAINDRGQVVGMAGKQVLFWSPDGSYRVLPGAYKGDTSVLPYALNASGTVVGTDSGEAALWQDFKETFLPTLPPYDHSSVALAINDSGVVVGQGGILGGDAYDSAALIWHDGTVTNLNDYMPSSLVQQGYRLTQAVGISKSGIIAAVATTSGGSPVVARLVPKP